MIFYLSDEYRWRHGVLTGLGHEGTEDRAETILDPGGIRPGSGTDRRAEVERFIAETGGDFDGR